MILLRNIHDSEEGENEVVISFPFVECDFSWVFHFAKTRNRFHITQKGWSVSVSDNAIFLISSLDIKNIASVTELKASDDNIRLVEPMEMLQLN